MADKADEVVRIRLRPDCGSKTVTGEMVGGASVPFDVAAPVDPTATEDNETAGWDEPPMERRLRWSLLTAFSTVFSTAPICDLRDALQGAIAIYHAIAQASKCGWIDVSAP